MQTCSAFECPETEIYKKTYCSIELNDGSTTIEEINFCKDHYIKQLEFQISEKNKENDGLRVLVKKRQMEN